MISAFLRYGGILSILVFAYLAKAQNGEETRGSKPLRVSSSADSLLSPDTASTTYFHILSTGQSLAAGLLAAPTISNVQPYGNLSLSSGPGGYAPPLIPLVEQDSLESPSSGLANTLHVLDPQARPIVIGLHAVPGADYYSLKKGTPNWDIAMLQVVRSRSEVRRIDSTAGFLPIGVTVVHGENDFYNNRSSQYGGYLVEWQRDYENEVSSIIGRQLDLPMFISQMNTGWSPEMALAMYQAHKSNPGKIMLSGPKYQYRYQPDHLHLLNVESKHLGEMFAKVINEVALKGNSWSPLMPTAVHRAGNVFTITYHIPAGTLTIDTITVSRRPHYGFEFMQTGGNNVSITDVSLINRNTAVQITLDSIPTGFDQAIRYACNCYSSGSSLTWCGNGGDGTAVGGNIRDTDTLVSPAIGGTGLPLYDWGVAFEEPIPGSPVGMQLPSEPLLDVFPNPGHSLLLIRTRGGLESIRMLVLHDLTGREVRRLVNAEPVQEALLAVEDLPAGIYVLTIGMASGPDRNCRVMIR